ncbi:timeless protein-domain-containing protein [Chlamydoabsidia padenii]|nr:timeless protein-domain-containing protein [Chlamydoabsidia padenii]
MDESDTYLEEHERTRQLILTTCTALGGFEDSLSPEGTLQRKYTLGDEALPCLKDLKRIIRADELLTKDILIELNVLETDLIPIILTQAKKATPAAERLVLACVEIIVPMTWPIARKPEENEDDQDPNLLHNYRKLKLKLLENGVFEAILRVCVKSLKIPYRERSSRDQAIIRLTLYLWRNLTAIVDPKASSISSDEKVLLSKLQERLLIRFHEANVLELLLTIASTTGATESNEWNTILLEIIYNLLEFAGVKETATVDNKDKNKYNAASKTLSTLLQSENSKKRLKTQHAPSRHNRFGGTYTLEGWDGSKHVSHKQSGGYAEIEELVNLRQKNRGGQKRKQRDEIGTHNTYEDRSALLYLKRFSLAFLESCFNAFYSSILKDMQREDKSIVERDYARFYFTQKWFLELFGYEIAAVNTKRMEKEKQEQLATKDQLILPGGSQQPNFTNENGQSGTTLETPSNQEGTSIHGNTTDAPVSTNPDDHHSQDKEPGTFDYDLIANIMDLNMFWACMRRIRVCMDDKLWFDVQVTADCLRQMLTTLNGMGRSTVQEHRDVAEYIQRNIYHEQFTLDIFPDLIRTYSNQSFGYIETVIQLIHVILKLLEQYCKQEQVHFVRRKKAPKRKPKKPADVENSPSAEKEVTGHEDQDSQDEEDRDQQIAYREHVFAFKSFEKRFATYDFVRVSCILLEDYQNLRPEVLHAITSIFHRIMVKTKAEHLFWKMPTLELFNRIIQDRASIPKTPALDQLVQFIRYVVRQFIKKSETYPLLLVETLFKIEPCRIAENKTNPPPST